MDESLQPLIWWIAAVDIPVIGSLIIMILHSQKDQAGRFDTIRNIMDASHDDLWQLVTDFKLVVARSYASNDYSKDVEQRLIVHLLRIESKLENQRQITLPGFPDPPVHSNPT